MLLHPTLFDAPALGLPPSLHPIHHSHLKRRKDSPQCLCCRLRLGLPPTDAVLQLEEPLPHWVAVRDCGGVEQRHATHTPCEQAASHSASQSASTWQQAGERWRDEGQVAEALRSASYSRPMQVGSEPQHIPMCQHLVTSAWQQAGEGWRDEGQVAGDSTSIMLCTPHASRQRATAHPSVPAPGS